MFDILLSSTFSKKLLRITHLIIFLGLLTVAGLAIQAEAAQYFVSVDKRTYSPGDVITVTGKVPLPEPKISATDTDGTILKPNYYHVTVGTTRDLALPQELGLADCQYFDFDNLPADMHETERNAGGPVQEPGKYYRYHYENASGKAAEYVRTECGFDTDGNFSFVIDTAGQPDGKYKVGFTASQKILTADGKLDSRNWDKGVKFEIHSDMAPEQVPEPEKPQMPPTVASAKISSPNKVTIIFSEKIKAPKSAFSDFTVTGEDKSRKILSKSASNSDTITLTIGGQPMPSGTTATLDISNKVENKAGVELAMLDDHPVTDGQPVQTTQDTGLVERLQSVIAGLEKKVRNLADRITKLTVQNEELTDKNTKLASENEKLTDKNENLAADVDDLKQQVADLQHELNPPTHVIVTGPNYHSPDGVEHDLTTDKETYTVGETIHVTGKFHTGITMPHNGTILYPVYESVDIDGTSFDGCFRSYPYEIEKFNKWKEDSHFFRDFAVFQKWYTFETHWPSAVECHIDKDGNFAVSIETTEKTNTEQSNCQAHDARFGYCVDGKKGKFDNIKYDTILHTGVVEITARIGVNYVEHDTVDNGVDMHLAWITIPIVIQESTR